MKPWEKYASQDSFTPQAGPWAKYAELASPDAPRPATPSSAEPAPAASKHADGIANKLLGLGEAGLSVASSIPASIAGQAYGIGKNLASGKFGTKEGLDIADKAAEELTRKMTYAPRTEAGRQDLETMGRAFDTSRLAGLPIEGPMLSRLPEVPRGVLATGEGAAGAARAGAQAAGRATGRAVASALPEVDPETLQLAREAHSMGFRLRPDQLYGNKYTRMAGELSSQVPMSGATTEHNQAVFNRNLVSLIGGEGDKLTRKVFDQAMKSSGKTIGDIAAKNPLPVDKSLVQALRSNAAGQLPEVSSVIKHYADFVAKNSRSGALPGTTFRRLNSAISKRIRETSNGDLKAALSDFQDDLMEARAQTMSAEDRAAYDTARRQYAIGKTLERLVAKSPTGDVSPAALLGAVTATGAGKSAMARGASGQLGKLADIGQRFLKEPASSGTAERSLVQKALPYALTAGAGYGASTAPGVVLPALAGPYAAANAYNRLGPAVTEQLLQRPPR